MGCNGSKDNGTSAGPEEIPAAYDRRRKCSVREPNLVPKVDEKTPNIIFIFGGPGSKKGRILDDIMTTYKFSYINGEETMREEIMRRTKVACDITSIKQLKKVVDEDPEHVSIKNALSSIERRIDTQVRDSGVKFFVVDLLPNLRYLLKSNRLTIDCQPAFEHFEKKYPISFAFNLAIPPEKIIKPVVCSKPDNKDVKEGEKKAEKKGDEADSGRTQKRIDAYMSNVTNFLNYFAESDRMLTIDVASGDPDLIWNCTRQIFNGLDYRPYRSVNTVFLFCFTEEEVEQVDIVKFDMQIVKLREVLSDPMASLESATEALSRHINNRCEGTESFVINAVGTSLEPAVITKSSKKTFLFSGNSDLVSKFGMLEGCLPGTPEGYVPPPGSTLYKVVRSTENEVCLFPKDSEDVVCHEIAAHLLALRSV